jgi:shikimate dehydrogenase
MAIRRLAVLGHPISHSRSPAIHNAAFAALGIEAEWRFEALDVEPERFAETVASMPADGFVGASVTVPHKLEALRIAATASDAAREIGAANTLSFDDGEVRADNTDAEGLLGSLPSSPRGRRALVLGAGGAARAVVWALAGAGARPGVWNRTAERARLLADTFGVDLIPGEPDASAFDLIVNATSVGLGDGSMTGLPLEAGSFRPDQTVVDLVYGNAQTELITAARGAGATTVNGLEVLVRQGAASFRIWTGLEPPIEAMRAAAGD